MARCEVCGNDDHRSFQIYTDRGMFTFDSLECAIRLLAPQCIATNLDDSATPTRPAQEAERRLS